ncbi:MAG: hypothetical protein AB7P03_05945 [Kofleriaceae bacterium]
MREPHLAFVLPVIVVPAMVVMPVSVKQMVAPPATPPALGMRMLGHGSSAARAST